MNETDNKLLIIIDALMYIIDLVTLLAPVVLIIYSTWYVITHQSWDAFLFISVAVVMLVVNVLLRANSNGSGPNPGAG